MADLFTLKDIDASELVNAIYDLEKEKNPGVDKTAIETRFEKLSAGQILARYATNDRLQNTPSADEVLTKDEAKAVGKTLLKLEKNNEKEHKLHPTIMVLGGDGKKHPLEPKELSAWLQANAKNEKNIPVEKWVADNAVSLTGEATPAQNGAEQLLIETTNGQRRVVGNGNLSEPIKGNYGGVVGYPVGDGDLLDVYISSDAMKTMSKDTPYTGPVFVMQQMDKGKNDELKVGYAKNVDEFKTIMTSTWKDPKDFEKLNEGRIIELTQEQYTQLKEAIKQKPDIALDEFVKGSGLKMEDIERKPEKRIGQGVANYLGIAFAGASDHNNIVAPTVPAIGRGSKAAAGLT